MFIKRNMDTLALSETKMRKKGESKFGSLIRSGSCEMKSTRSGLVS